MKGKAKNLVQNLNFGLLCPFPLSITIMPLWSNIYIVFANDLGDQGSIPGRVIPKTQNIVLDSTIW